MNTWWYLFTFGIGSMLYANSYESPFIHLVNQTDWKIQVDYERNGKKEQQFLEPKSTGTLKDPKSLTILTVEPYGRFWSLDSVVRLVGDWIRSKNLVPKMNKKFKEYSSKALAITISLPAKLKQDFRTFNITVAPYHKEQ